MSSSHEAPRIIGVAEAKGRFSELIERVSRGERFLVTRRGKPAVALVPPNHATEEVEVEPIGLAGVAGALAEWEDLEEMVSDVYRARRGAKDRTAPPLE